MAVGDPGPPRTVGAAPPAGGISTPTDEPDRRLEELPAEAVAGVLDIEEGYLQMDLLSAGEEDGPPPPDDEFLDRLEFQLRAEAIALAPDTYDDAPWRLPFGIAAAAFSVVVGVAGKLYSLGGQTDGSDTDRALVFDPASPDDGSSITSSVSRSRMPCVTMKWIS